MAGRMPFGPNNEDPRLKGQRSDLVQKTVPQMCPWVLIPPLD